MVLLYYTSFDCMVNFNSFSLEFSLTALYSQILLLFHWAKWASSIQYRYMKCKTHAPVFSQIFVHENGRNEIRHRNRGKFPCLISFLHKYLVRWEEKSERWEEISEYITKHSRQEERCPKGLTVAWEYSPLQGKFK